MVVVSTGYDVINSEADGVDVPKAVSWRTPDLCKEFTSAAGFCEIGSSGVLKKCVGRGVLSRWS